MKFVETLLTNHPLVNILFVVVLTLGALSYAQLPREQDPEINFHWVNVTAALPGASTSDVEELVTSPLEDALQNVKNIEWVSSNTREGVSSILIRIEDMSEREYDKRIVDIRREMQNKTNSELPEEVEDPYVLEVTTSTGFPTATVVLVGQANDELLRMQSRIIKDDIERIDGVHEINAFGLQDPELHVEFDPVTLARHNLTAADVANALQSDFRNTAAGDLNVASQKWLVRVQRTTANPEELAQFTVAPAAEPQRKIRLDNIATISRAREDPYTLVDFEGLPAISFAITKQAYTNTIELVNEIAHYVEQRNAALEGTGLRLLLADDQTVQTREALGVMERNAALGLTLVLMVCWLFLGIRIAFMVTLGIVFSIAGTFVLLNATGNTMNISVLLGIVIVLGMLVDDAVVVVEAMHYRLLQGVGALDSAMAALNEVGKPVLSAVCTTMAAFLPLMLLPGIVGKFMFVIPFVVTVGLAVSLIEAFWILPAHVISIERRLKVGSHPKDHWRNRWTHKVRILYTRILAYVMRRPLAFLGGALAAFALAIAALVTGQVRQEFFTFDPLRIFYVNVDMPASTPLEETLAHGKRVEQRVREMIPSSEIRAITTLAGIKFTETEALFGDQHGQIQVALNPKSPDSPAISDMVDGMRDYVTATPGDGSISFLEIGGGPPATKPIDVKVRNDDFDELQRSADAVVNIARNIVGTEDVFDDDVPGRNELILELDESAIREAGLSPALVARLIRLHLEGEVVSFIRDTDEKLELRVRGKRRKLQSIEDILDDPIVLASGGTTTFRALTSIDTVATRSVIRHFNFRRTIKVQGEINTELTDTVTVNQTIKDEWEKIRSQHPNTDLDFTGQLDDIDESLDSMKFLFLLGVGLIYLILATQFKSYWQPMLIIFTVPMAFTGVVAGLYISGNPFSLYTLYGVVALTGIAVNAAIVLIDAANARLEAGMRPLHATVYAGRRRIVPILMTTFTTIAGLSSLAFGLGGKSLLWGPVAVSIVAGLFVSGIMTLLVIPILYRFAMRGRSRTA